MKHNLILIAVFFLIISCKNDCRDIRGNEINEMLVINANKNNIDYCSLYNKSKDGNPEAIKKISLLNFEDSTGYEQGIILIDLINYIGEQKYIEALSSIKIEDKHKILLI